MKKTLLPLLLIPAVWVGATWFISSNTESTFDNILSASNQQVSEMLPFIKMEKQSFEKGLISSDAKSLITLDFALFQSENADPLKLSLEHKIYHGPLMFTPDGIKTGSSYIITTLDQSSLPEDTKKLIALLFNDETPFSAGVTTGTSDNVDVNLSMAALSFNPAKFAELTGDVDSFDDSDNINMTLDGAEFNFNTNSAASFMHGSMSIGEMTVKGIEDDTSFDMVMSPSSAEIEGNELYKGSLLDGDIEFSLPNVSFSDGEGTDINLSDIRIFSSAKSKNGFIGGLSTFDIEKLHIKTPDTNLDFPDAKIHLGFDVEGLARADIINLLDLGQDMNKSQLMFLGNDDVDELSDDMMKSTIAYYRAAGAMIKQGVKTGFVFDISNENGNASAKLDLSYIDTKELYALKTVKDLAMALQGSLSIKIDKSMLAGTPLEEAIAMPIMMGFAVEKDTAYESSAELNGGELKLNGQPVPFLDMVGDQGIPWDEIFDK